MIFKADEYKSKKSSMPNVEDKTLDKNSKEYNLKVAEYMYGLFCKGNTYISYDSYSAVQRNRRYAHGLQDSAIYEDSFYGKENSNNVVEDLYNQNIGRKARKKAVLNLNFDIQSPAPRVMDSIVNKLMELVNRVSVDAQDEYSGAERENIKWGSYVDGKYKKEFEALRALAALPSPEQGYTPKSVEELNLYEAEGGFKLGYEETMETLLKYVFEQSKWDEYIVEQVLEDLVALGYTCVEDVYDKHTGQVRINYIDAEYAGVQYTKEAGNYNPDYGFYVKKVKMSELKKRGYGQDEILNVAKIFSSTFGNPSIEDWNRNNKVVTNEMYEQLDDWTVPVFVVKWIDVEHKTEKGYKNRQGKRRTKAVDPKYKFKKGEEEINTRYKMLREVHWVIASEIVYDYGLCEFQARDGNNDPVLPIHMVQVANRPLIPRMIPALDQYMQGWMKLQQGLSMSVMNGYAIDMDAVSNLKMNGQKLAPLEVLRLWRQTGTLFFKRTDVAGRPNGVQSRPIEALTGGAGAVIQEAMSVMDVAMREIENTTGINPVSMGASPTAEQGKAVTEFAIMGTNDILKGILKKANVVKSDVARNTCLRLSHVVSADSRAYNLYKNIVGETRLETLKIANGHDVYYGIRTHARPTAEEENSMREMLANALKNGRDGKARITEGDYFRFLGMLKSGASLKRIALLLDFALDKAQQREDAKAAEGQKLAAQMAQETQAQKAQQEQQVLIMETQSEIAKDNNKGKNSIIEEAVKNGEIKALQALGMLGVGGMQQPQPPQQQPQQGREPEPTLPVRDEAV